MPRMPMAQVPIEARMMENAGSTEWYRTSIAKSHDHSGIETMP